MRLTTRSPWRATLAWEVRWHSQPLVIVIAAADGLVELRLQGDARDALGSLRVGSYVMADGEKETEQLYWIDELDVDK